MNLQWVPIHAGIRGNETADETAGLAAALPQDRVPVNYNAARVRLKQYPNREWAGSNRHDALPDRRSDPRQTGDKMDFNRKESVAMTRLRTGHSTMLRAYRHRIGLDDDPECSDCDDGVPEDATHLLMWCPAGALARHRVFGRSDPTLKEVFTDAGRVLEYLRRLGSL